MYYPMHLPSCLKIFFARSEAMGLCSHGSNRIAGNVIQFRSKLFCFGFSSHETFVYKFARCIFPAHLECIAHMENMQFTGTNGEIGNWNKSWTFLRWYFVMCRCESHFFAMKLRRVTEWEYIAGHKLPAKNVNACGLGGYCFWNKYVLCHRISLIPLCRMENELYLCASILADQQV